jgi:ribonucleoside-diphosphate reductase alpha chain
MAKEGSTIGGLMDSLGTAISVALQYGVPVQSLVNKFAHQRFEPMGITTNSDIPFAKSLVDYIFRWLGIQFIEGYREQNAPNRGETKTGTDLPRKSKTNNTVKEDTPRWKQDATDTMSKDSTITTPDPTGTVKTDGTSSNTPTTSTGVPDDQGNNTPGGAATTQPSASVLDQLNANLMGDAPACDVCGSITVRNGTCYKCNNCGNSMGCS